MGRDVPLNLPHGWDYDKVFGEEAHPPMPLQRDAALAAPAALKMAVSEATLYALADDVQIGGAGLALPQTATHWQLKIAAGATLTLLGLVALALQRLGVQARSWMGWQLPVRTTASHGRARILDIDTDEIKQLMAAGGVPVVTGFQGLSPEGRVTTIGRGGSDTLAVALAAKQIRWGIC